MSLFTLKKGKHYASGLHFGVHFGVKEQNYNVNFSKECLYTPTNWENDYNKLCGWSYGFLPVKHQTYFSASPDFRLFGVDYVWDHHYNSIRVCWRPIQDNGTYSKIELCLYVYEEGVRRLSTDTLKVNIEESIALRIKYDKETNASVYLTENYTNFIKLANYLVHTSLGFRLFTFFGGNDPAPQTMTVKVERI